MYASYSELQVRYLKFNNTNVVPTLIICQTRLGDYIAKFNDKIKVSDDPSAVSTIYNLLTVSQTNCLDRPLWKKSTVTVVEDDLNEPKFDKLFDIRISILQELTLIVSYGSI